LLALARYRNVAVKATGQEGYAEDAYPFRSLHPHLGRCFDAFGPERMFWSTDITRMPCSWRQCVSLFTEELPWLKGRDRDLVMGEALCNWIGWPLACEPKWIWGLSLVALTIAVHVTGVTFLVSVLHRLRVRLERRSAGLPHVIALVIPAFTAMGLLLAVLHGVEAAFWAAAYLWLGALDSPGAAMLYSVDSMATRGASRVLLERPGGGMKGKQHRPHLMFHWDWNHRTKGFFEVKYLGGCASRGTGGPTGFGTALGAGAR
jgi:hypothetical protein